MLLLIVHYWYQYCRILNYINHVYYLDGRLKHGIHFSSIKFYNKEIVNALVTISK